jgi:hypothetical protein
MLNKSSAAGREKIIIIEGLRASQANACSYYYALQSPLALCALYYRMELIAISWFALFESLFCAYHLRRQQARERMLILHTMMPAEQ